MIQVLPDVDALDWSAATFLAERARKSSDAQGQFSLVISGGQTPRGLYELLAGDAFRDRLPWTQMHVFWGDERCVPTDDPRSNERMAREALLNHVPIPPIQIHPIRCAKGPPEAARQYETLLRTFFRGLEPRFDLVLLGLGENGHTASLFPRTPVLEERERWVVDILVEGEDLHRLTFTAPIINQAASVVFLVTGSAKAHVLHEVLEGPFDPHRLPAQLIRPTHGELIWLVDKEAAALLRKGT
jgi:6-phosphogluconolactonase